MTLDVTVGSLIAVDPRELLAIADRIDVAVGCANRAVDHVSRALEFAGRVPGVVLWTYPGEARMRCESWREACQRLAAAVRRAAMVYEALELRTLLAMHGTGAETADGRSAAGELDALATTEPGAVARANQLWVAWQASAGHSLVENWKGAGAPVMAALLASLGAFRERLGMGRGSLGEPRRTAWRAERVPGVSDRIVRMIVTNPRRVTAPNGLADSISRIPNGQSDEWGENARVRIDRYDLASGEERFVVYIGGSREAPWDDSDPFSWENNLGLYSGVPESQGYDFVLEALERAGAEAGSVVDVNGFSQGAMVAQRIATDSDFEVRHVTTLGSPLRIPLGEDVTSLTLAHDDDPVAALSDGGSPARLGGDDSLLIRRTFEQAHTGLAEWDVEAHRVGAYAETARAFEESDDVRRESVRAYFAELRESVGVESFVFHAPEDPRRVDRDGGGAEF